MKILFFPFKKVTLYDIILHYERNIIQFSTNFFFLNFFLRNYRTNLLRVCSKPILVKKIKNNRFDARLKNFFFKKSN